MLSVQTLVVGRVSTNCYIVHDPETREAAVIDPGDRAEAILEAVRENGLNVRCIFLTHGHFDHVLALEKVRSVTGAKAVAHQADGVKADILAQDGEFFPLGGYAFEVLHTPGHTPGCICLRIENLLFTGDTLFEDDCGRCDLPRGDYRVMLKSLRRLAELEGDYKVYPGHDVSTTLSRERECNASMREALKK
jgi:glyoxylase-like metal-dependent hydrolase (beta-lactamase superfamily II)